MARTASPSDLSDDAWACVAPALTLRTADAPQRNPPRRERFNGLRGLAQARAPVGRLTAQVPDVTGDAVAGALVDQGEPGDQPAQEAAAHGRHRDVVKLPEAKKSVVRWPRRWVVERCFAWAARLLRLARDDERVLETLRGVPCLVCALLLRTRFVAWMVQRA
jgi:transposase